MVRTHEHALLALQHRSGLPHSPPPSRAQQSHRMPKATAVVSDSDSEMEITKSTKKTSGSAASKTASNKGATQNGNADSGDEDEGSSAADEEEYEIEAILDAKHGVFAHVRVVPLPHLSGIPSEGYTRLTAN